MAKGGSLIIKLGTTEKMKTTASIEKSSTRGKKLILIDQGRGPVYLSAAQIRKLAAEVKDWK